jgi:GMC oxidoreductase
MAMEDGGQQLSPLLHLPRRADEKSVVDNGAGVHDVEGLRVVDASFMPEIVRGNPGHHVGGKDCGQD